MQFTEQFDVVVVGAGHAGCEAAMAAARMGLKTALYTLNVDLIAQMSCNPAIGGIAKGHLVREVDALGGIMGEITDAVGIQFRLLNTSRGPAVWSPRAQCDKQAYRLKMREVLESQPNLKIKQAEVADLIVEQSQAGTRHSAFSTQPSEGLASDQRLTTNDRVCRGIKLRDGRTVGASAVIITTGTFLCCHDCNKDIAIFDFTEFACIRNKLCLAVCNARRRTKPFKDSRRCYFFICLLFFLDGCYGSRLENKYLLVLYRPLNILGYPVQVFKDVPEINKF